MDSANLCILALRDKTADALTCAFRPARVMEQPQKVSVRSLKVPLYARVVLSGPHLQNAANPLTKTPNVVIRPGRSNFDLFRFGPHLFVQPPVRS